MQLKYKDYFAEVTFSAIPACFHGEVINLKKSYDGDSIIFLASCRQLLGQAFKQAVEQYLLLKREVITIV